MALQIAALEATANAVLISDRHGKVVWVNSAFEQLTGYTREEMLGHDTRLLRSGQNSQALYAEMWRTILEGKVWRGELVNRRKNGSLYDEEMTITPVLNGAEEITHFIAIKLDITERKRNEEQSCRLAQAIETSPELIGMASPEGCFTYVNQAFLKICGYSEDELLGKRFDIVLSPNNPAGLIDDLGVRMFQSSGWTGECLVLRRDGTDFPVVLRAGRVEDKEGRTVGSFGIAEDITERKRKEEELRGLAAIVEGSDDAIIGKTLEGTILSWNAGAERMYGYSAAEAIGKPISMIISHERADEMLEIIEKLKQGEVVKRLETIRVRSDGKQIHIALTVSPIKDATGKIIAASAIGRDITESRRMEEMFRQAQKMEAVGRLAGGVAHDFNNLLSVIIGYSEMLLDSASRDSQAYRHAEEIKKSGHRAASLTRQLLAFSRQQVLEPRVLDLNQIVAGIEKMLRRLIGEDIELRTSLDPALGAVKADPGQIEQVIMNLAVNARDAMPQGGKLVIETSNVDLDENYALLHMPAATGRYVLFSISDTGTGIDAETKAHIFEPFFTTKELGKGTGLGLATVYGIVKQSGGYIWVYSEPKQGAVFKIYLPRIDKAVQQIQLTAGSPQVFRGTETILLVEDEESLRTMTRTLLEQSGYKVLEAKNGVQAVEVAREHQGAIHLLLTDVVMPGTNGPTLVAKLVPLRPEMKVLYVSGYSGNYATGSGLVEMGWHLLQKPFSRDVLLRKVREVLEMRKESNPN
jgi:two-component system cell cycle sensor histidine kinase/response regulator CckA